MMFKQTESVVPRESNWIYIQLDQGCDSILTKYNLFEAFEQARLRGVRNIRIYNDDTGRTDATDYQAGLDGEDKKQSYYKKM
jgi:hypothetical protein